MNKKLLTDWAEALEELEKTDWKTAGFDMETWMVGDHVPKDRLLGCGTVCCAYGVGTTLDSWKDAGLKLHKINGKWEHTTHAWGILGIGLDDWMRITQAVMYHVGPTRVLRSLCGLSDIPVSPSLVAERIRMVIDKYAAITP